MTYVVRSKTEPLADHEVSEVTDSGNYVTKCQKLVMADDVAGAFTDTVVNCRDCISPPTPVAPKPRKARAQNAKPQWRTARNQHAEMTQSLKFAHQAIVAAMEWAGRGEEGQFNDNALDQTHMAFRFLKEVLVDHRRIQDDTQDDTE